LFGKEVLKMKFSFILPVYNAENTVKTCINSIRNQDKSELEIICIDDCSSDGSVVVIKELQKMDSRIVVLRNERNMGTLCSRKKGVLAASGDYILFADNDDTYLPNACSVIQKEMEKDPVDILMYGVETADLGARSISLAAKVREETILTPIPEIYEGENCLKTKNRISLLWNKAVKASICKKAYSHAEDIYLTVTEDRYASYLIHYYAKSFRSINDRLYCWNTTTGVSTRRERNIEQFERLCRCMSDGSSAIEKLLLEINDNSLYESNKSSGNGAGYCIDEWCHSIEENKSIEALELVHKYYGDDIFRLLHRKINYLEKERDKYESVFLMLCKSKVFRIFFFIYRKVLRAFPDECF
jgi:glycosyltransferase involved in cell wall biosynthesis